MEAAAAVKSTAFQPLLCFYPCFLISISSLFSFFYILVFTDACLLAVQREV